MTIDADKIRELCTRRESRSLDFKRDHYSLDVSDGKKEFINDVMAMANALSPNDTNAFILIGVAEHDDGTGVIVGFEPHPNFNDDANFQTMVADKMNRRMDFSYKVVLLQTDQDAGPHWVGVVEISPGQRPFFPINNKMGLKKNVALVRSGSSKGAASPQEIYEWALQDTYLAAEREKAQVIKMQRKPRCEQKRIFFKSRPRFSSVGAGGRVRSSPEPETELIYYMFKIFNIGPCSFRITRVVSEIRKKNADPFNTSNEFDHSNLLKPGDDGVLTIFTTAKERRKIDERHLFSLALQVTLQSDLGDEASQTFNIGP